MCEARKVVYWGDIDGPGLAFLSDLRGHGVAADSILIDRATLDQFRHLAVDGAVPDRRDLAHLTAAERELYTYLSGYATEQGRGLLLEQERIPWRFAHQQAMDALSLC